MFSSIPSPTEARHAAVGHDSTDGLILKALNKAVSGNETKFELHGSESFIFEAYSRLINRGYKASLEHDDDTQGVGYNPPYLLVSF